MEDKRVLSIQSHVVSGYVGNKSATFPLQVLGFEVDAINSVQFSNHTGYPGGIKGQVLEAQALGDLFEGLKQNKLHLNYSHLLTGYIGSESFLLKVQDVVKELKSVNPNLIYVCDPVMGDRVSGKPGFMYVPEALLPAYKKHIIPLADICTPNQYEAELLTDMPINDEETARAAMKKLHDMGVGTVVLSSTEFGPEDQLTGLGSCCKDGKYSGFKITIPKLHSNFTGTGDLFTSLLLAWSHQHPDDLVLACSKTQSTMQHVLKRTLKKAHELAGKGNAPTKAQKELQLIQSKNDIENPELIVKAVPW